MTTVYKQVIDEGLTQLLDTSLDSLVPRQGLDNKNVLKNQTISNPKSELDSYYLFAIDEITVNSDCDDIPEYINSRFQTILSAVQTANVSIALLISSSKGRNQIYIGFKNEGDSRVEPEWFESIVNGVLPGKKIRFKDTVSISSLAEENNYGGVITGIPVIKKDDNKHTFNLSSVIRSLYEKDYLLAIFSKPVSDSEKQQTFKELLKIRDELHSQAKKTAGENKSNTDSKTKSTSHNLSGSLILASYSYNSSDSTSPSSNFGTSLSYEQQNGMALELEKAANQYVERMVQGFNTGLWETTISFTSDEKISCDILGGVFLGELSKPNESLLPPPKFYSGELNPNQVLFIPKADSGNHNIFAKNLSSYITTEELAIISSPPTESTPGYEIKTSPALALTDRVIETNGLILGHIAEHGNPLSNARITLSTKDLNKHLFVCGLTGSGKTTTVKHILKSLSQEENIPFLIIESAKRDYRQLLADDAFKDKLNIFTIGDSNISPIGFNPFYVQKGVQPLVHIDFLKAIFNASFSLYGPMPSIVEKCLHNIYKKKGWNLTTGVHPAFLDKNGYLDESIYKAPEHYYCFPTLSDLKNEVDHYITNELDYKGELRDNIRTAIIVRLESLCVGAKGIMFNTHNFFSIEELLSKNTILEMESLADDDDKAFFVGLILVLISEYSQKENPAINPGVRKNGLQHLIVIEEAHRLLKNIETERSSEMMGNPKGKAVEVFCNMISEMRSLGLGVAVVEQIPSKIAPDVIKNSNTKIVHRLVAKDDQSLLAGSLSISDEEALYLNRLNTGHALCHKEGMERPVECVVINDVDSHAVSDEKIHQNMKLYTAKAMANHHAYDLDSVLGEKGTEFAIKALNSLITIEPDKLDDLHKKLEVEFQKLLLIDNYYVSYSRTLLAEFFVLKVLTLVNAGIYRCFIGNSGGLIPLLEGIINKPASSTRKDMVKSLSGAWNREASNFISDVVCELSLKYILKNKITREIDPYTKVVGSFFYISIENKTVVDISKKCYQRGVA